MSDTLTWAYAADIIHKDAKERVVYAIATGPKMDLDGQGCDPTWLRSAVPDWMRRGNVRLMHNPTIPPVGKATKAVETPDQEWAVAIKVVDDQAWKLVDEGLLTGVSVGVKNATIVQDPRYPKGLIKGGTMIEMSLVDYPAYSTSKLASSPEEIGVSVFKRVGSSIHYAGAVIEDETPAAVDQLNKAAGALEPPAAMRQRLEMQRQAAEERQAASYGILRNPYEGQAFMAIPGKTAAADLVKRQSGAAPEKNETEEAPKMALTAKRALPETWKVVVSKKGELLVKCGDCETAMVYPIEEYLPQPMTGEDGQVQLQGHEAAHTEVVNQIIAGFKQLVMQEMQEDELEFDCVQDLADAARQFLAWVAGEQIEGEYDAMYEAVAVAAVAMVAEPDRAKRVQMAKAITTTLSKLSQIKEAAMAGENDVEKAGKPADDEKDKKGKQADGEQPDDKEPDGDEDDAKKAAAPDLEKEGRAISSATAARLQSLAETPGVPESVGKALGELAGFEWRGPTEPQGKNELPAVANGASAASGNLQREEIQLESPFASVVAEVSGEFVGNTGKAAAPDVAKAFRSGLEKIATDAAVAAIEKIVTSDTFVSKIADGIQAKVAAAEATEVAKAASQAVADVRTAMEGEITKMRDEMNRIKQLPQPAKGAVSEDLASVQKRFAANPEGSEPAVAAPAATSGEEIMKRALAGDINAQRTLREAVEKGVQPDGQNDVAKAAYKATVTGKAA